MENLSKDVITRIKRSIAHNNRKDEKEFGIKGVLSYDDYISKMKEQNGKCYVCLQEFKFDGKQWCYFFPSPDRIYNGWIHSKENVAISCVFCNIRFFKQVSKKICGLCTDLNHNYEGEIITKSKLFRSLGNDNNNIKKYINSLFVTNQTRT